MNLAARDVRVHLGRFFGTAAGLGLLFAVVVSMQGIYQGMVDDATILTRAMAAELWVVQRATRGPFAEASRVDPSLEARVAAVPGVRRARAYTYVVVQREHRGKPMRLALVGLSWPDDPGRDLPLVAGRALAQGHGEIIVDASLGVGIGETLRFADEPYRVVGLTRNALTSAGDAVAFLTLSDSHAVANELPDEAVRTERQRALERLRRTDLGRSQPALEDLTLDAAWRAPVTPDPAVSAILVNVDAARVDEVRRVLSGWGDVGVYSQEEERELLVSGLVQRARMQLGLFSVILTLTASVIVMMVVYNMSLERTHDLAVLSLLGAGRLRLVGLIVQQAWLLGAVGYAFAFGLGLLIYPLFPRRVLLTPEIQWGTPIVIFLLTTLASVAGLVHASRVDVGRVLES